MRFIRCRTCGKYIHAQSALRERYCSEECAVAYASCLNCGKFFQIGKGFNERHCSQACTVQYKIQRFFGPEAVRKLTEELA